MKVVAACSWFSEDPEDLRRMIRSLRGLADRIVFVDGPYALFPAGRTRSSARELAVIHTECVKAGLDYTLHQRETPWAGNEVEKRAFMLQLALAGTTTADWVVQIDADVEFTDHTGVRDKLEATDLHVASAVCDGISNLGADRKGRATTRGFVFRPFYRALPGLTVEGQHWRHVAGDLVLWGRGSEQVEALESGLRVHHHHRADSSRTRLAERYYEAREEAGIER